MFNVAGTHPPARGQCCQRRIETVEVEQQWTVVTL